MKKYIKVLFVFLTFFLVFGVFKQTKVVAPQTTYAIELNIGEAAKTKNIPGTDIYDPETPDNGFGIWIGKLLTIIMTIGALLVFANLLWGSIQFIISGGDKGKTESARNRITQSIIGLIVLASTLAIFTFIQNFLGLEILKFSNPSTSPTATESGSSSSGTSGYSG